MRAVFPHVVLLARAPVLAGEDGGNLVAVASDAELPVDGLVRRCAADPMPSRVVAGNDLVRFAGDARPVPDAEAQPSPEATEKQHARGKYTARERIERLCDAGSRFLEVGLLVAHDQYDGQAPAAGVVTAPVVAGLSAAFIVMYLAGGLFDGEEFRFVANSVAKDVLFVALAVIGLIASLLVPRRRLWVRVREDDDGLVVEYAGLARGDDPNLERAVAELERAHREALPTAAREPVDA